MELINKIEQIFSEKILALKNDSIFYGTVNHIKKLEHNFIVKIDLFNHTTQEIDENLIFSGSIKNITYSFELEITTSSLMILGHKNEIFQFQRVNKMESFFDTFEGKVTFLTHRMFDGFRPFNNEKILLKVSKLSLEERINYKKYISEHISYLENYCQIKERLKLIENDTQFNKNVGLRYSQYHVGYGNCTYINIGSISKGFFNLSYEKDFINNSNFYTGFSRHKPDWIIISNLNKDNYSGAIRYGREHLFKCDWILPMINDYNINLIRFLYCIVNSGGRIFMLKYKANASVCYLFTNDVKLEVYYTSEYDMTDNGLCLYIEQNDKFISFGNSDYNFLTKSLVNQNFDLIVIPHQGSKMKTKIHFNNKQNNKNPLSSTNYIYKNRRGFKIHRTDLLGNFLCKL